MQALPARFEKDVHWTIGEDISEGIRSALLLQGMHRWCSPQERNDHQQFFQDRGCSVNKETSPDMLEPVTAMKVVARDSLILGFVTCRTAECLPRSWVYLEQWSL